MMASSVEATFSSGIPQIDTILNGGLRRGEVAVVCESSHGLMEYIQILVSNASRQHKIFVPYEGLWTSSGLQRVGGEDPIPEFDLVLLRSTSDVRRLNGFQGRDAEPAEQIRDLVSFCEEHNVAGIVPAWDYVFDRCMELPDRPIGWKLVGTSPVVWNRIPHDPDTD